MTVNNHWYYYCLSDMLKNESARARSDGRKLHYKLYPDSLASQYMREADENWDIDILINLIKKHDRSLRPEKDELVIHLRVGDVVDGSIYTAKELLEKARPYCWGPIRLGGRGARGIQTAVGNIEPLALCDEDRHARNPRGRSRSVKEWMYYVKPLSFYEQLFGGSLGEGYYAGKRVKKITLVAGGCQTHDFTKSKEYIQVIKSLFEKGGFNVQVRLGNPPDDDFVYMCRSEFFIPSGGGFSRLVNDVRACYQQPDLVKTYRATAFSKNKKTKYKNENNNRNKL